MCFCKTICQENKKEHARHTRSGKTTSNRLQQRLGILYTVNVPVYLQFTAYPTLSILKLRNQNGVDRLRTLSSIQWTLIQLEG